MSYTQMHMTHTGFHGDRPCHGHSCKGFRLQNFQHGECVDVCGEGGQPLSFLALTAQSIVLYPRCCWLRRKGRAEVASFVLIAFYIYTMFISLSDLLKMASPNMLALLSCEAVLQVGRTWLDNRHRTEKGDWRHKQIFLSYIHEIQVSVFRQQH